LNAKLNKKIVRSLLEYFRIKVTTIEESKDLDTMKIEELVGSLQTYEFSLSPVKKAKSIALKAGKGKISSNEDTDDEEGIAMLAKNFTKLLKTKKFKNKFSINWKGDLEGYEQDDADKKDSRGPRCYECSGYGHMRAFCENLKQDKGKSLNTTLSDDSEEEETPSKDPKFLAFTTSYNDPVESRSYYSKSSGEEDLKEVYKTLFIKFMKLRKVNQRMCWS
jgi:hypothetical protein